jgi:expansin (peptidoglycan-binding protein)
MKNPPGGNPNKHPLCASNKCIEIRGSRGTVQLKISDTCPACKTYDVDVADEIFPKLEDPNRGRVKVQWRFIGCNMLEGESVKFNEILEEIPSEGRRMVYEKSSWTRWIFNR